MNNTMKRILSYLIILSFIISGFSYIGTNSASATDLDKPLLTFGCMSDLHNQGPIITSDDGVMRGTIGDTIDQMAYDEEKVDVIIAAGDISSNDETTEDKLYRILDMVQAKMLELTPNTLWVTGNHDFNAGGSRYNSADYYYRYVEPQMGALDEFDIYTESYGGIDYVCGYHYKVNGFDFICLLNSYDKLEGGKQQYNYSYSDGTIQWMDYTIEDIRYYAEPGEENKPIFIVAHFPFADSNSISDPGKGIIADCEKKMKDVFTKYTDIYYLYGHDHGTDSAYIRTDTAQRVTEYDEFGQVMNGPDNSEEEEPQFGEKSFTSLFMGSMRYYANSIDGWVKEANSQVVQALMVYVYYDRVEFCMKNYGTRAAEEWDLIPYVVEKQVIPYPTAEPIPTPDIAPGINPTPALTPAPGNNNVVVKAPDKASISKITYKKSAKKIIVNMKKVNNADGYQIEVCVNKKFDKKLKKNMKLTVNTKKTKCTVSVKKLKKAKKYYMRVRAYSVDGNKKVYGMTSKITTIK